MDTISLKTFLQRYLNDTSSDASEEASKAVRLEQVDTKRNREATLRRTLHPSLVRRLDAGFARSNTVHPDTGNALYTICHRDKIQNVFETGTYWGYSTSYLAAALEDKGVGKVYTFDIYDKAGTHIPPSLASRIEMFRGKPSVETMPGVLEKVVPDLFFQDSRHDYEGVQQELEIVVPYLKPGAIILFHDFVMPEVRAAATDVLKGYEIFEIETLDPQQLGGAVCPNS